jgi:hypothetical protein
VVGQAKEKRRINVSVGSQDGGHQKWPYSQQGSLVLQIVCQDQHIQGRVRRHGGVGKEGGFGGDRGVGGLVLYSR